MTSCNEFREDFVAFLDGELSGVRAESVRQHIAECSACEAECAALDGVWGALDHLPGLEPRSGWLEEVEASIVSPSVVPFPVWRRGLAAMALAAAVALAVGLGWLLSLPPESPADQLVVTQPAPRISPVDAPRVHTLPPRVRPDDEPDEARDEPGEQGPDAPGAEGVRPEQSATVEDPALALLEGLSDEELEMIEDLEVVAVLDELDELDVLENLELLEDLDDEELPDDA